MCADVLVAEDDIMQAEIIGHYLVREGHTARIVHEGNTALREIRRRPPDLLVLDVMMPALDGLDVCRVLRSDAAYRDLPVLMLTARTTEDDLLLAFELGADEYITKPYSPRELMARIQNLLRRTRAVPRQNAEGPDGTAAEPERSHVMRAGSVVVDRHRRTVTVDGRPVVCTAGEFDILAALAAEPGRVFSRRQLLSIERGTSSFITERTIDVHVLNLRKKIEPDPSRPVHLLTVFKVGYKLNDRSAPATSPLRSDGRY